MTAPDSTAPETPDDDSIVSDETEQFVTDPDAATEATRERMAVQAEQEKQAGHPVSSAPDNEAASHLEHSDNAAVVGDSTTPENSAPAHLGTPDDAAVGGMPTDSVDHPAPADHASGSAPLGVSSDADHSADPAPVGDPAPSDPAPSEPAPSEPAPQTAPSSVPPPDRGAPVPDVAPMPGVSPDPGDVPGEPLAPGAVSGDEGSEWAEPRGPH